MKWSRLATSNLMCSLSLSKPITKSHQKQ